MPTTSSSMQRAVGASAALVVGWLVAVLALPLPRAVRIEFGPSAADMGATLAWLGAALALLALRRRADAAHPARGAACALAAGCLLPLLPWLLGGAASLAASQGWRGRAASVAYLLPWAALGALLAFAVTRLAAMRGAAGSTLAWCLLGAAGGALALPSWWPAWGTAGVLSVSGAAALVSALALLLVDRPTTKDAATPTAAPAPRRHDVVAWGLALAAAAVAVTGRGWVRLLGAMLGDHILTATWLAVLTLVPAALGAWWGARTARGRARPGMTSLLLSLSAVGVVVSLLVLVRIPGAVLRGAELQTVLLRYVLPAVGPAALLWGAMLARALDDADAKTTGPTRLLALALGAGVGSLFALRWFAADHVLLGAGVLALVAAALRFMGPQHERRAAWALALGLPLLVLALPPVWRTLRDDGWSAQVVAAQLPRPTTLQLHDDDDVAGYVAWFGGTRVDTPGVGTHATRYAVAHDDTVSVLEGGALRTTTDPQARAFGTAAGLIGLVLRPGALRALVAAKDVPDARATLAAAGVRVRAALQGAPVPDTTRTSVRWVSGAVADHLEEATFDIVVAALGPPWRTDVALQTTREGWTRGRAALAKGGVWVQPLATLSVPLLATFQDVFTHCWVLRFESLFLLVGFESEPHLDMAHWERVLATGQQSAVLPHRAGFRTAADLWKHVVADDGSMKAGLTDVARREATRPRAEIEAARRRLHGRTNATPSADTQQFLVRAFPPHTIQQADRKRMGTWMRAALNAWVASERFDIARLWDGAWPHGEHPETLGARAEIRLHAGDAMTGGQMARRLRAQRPAAVEAVRLEARALFEGAKVQPATTKRAIEALARLASAYPEDGRALAAIASVLAALQASEKAQATFEQALAIRGEKAAPAGTQGALARLLLTTAMTPESEARAIKLLRGDPETYEDPEALDLLIRSLSIAGDEPTEDLELALGSLSRTRASEHLVEARHLLRRGAYADAWRAAREATRVWPESLEAWLVRAFAGLAVERAAGDTDATRDWPVVRTQLRAQGQGDPKTREEANAVLGWFGKRVEPAVQPPQ